jgi:hypothetical protein
MIVSMSLTLQNFQSSDLSKKSPEVFMAAEQAPVLVTRRDGKDFVLMTEAEAEARQKLLEFAAQLIAVTLDDRGSLADRMSNQFPWMLAFDEEGRVACAQELIDAARASFATQKASLAIMAFTSWRETALAIAEGLTIGEFDPDYVSPPVPRP